MAEDKKIRFKDLSGPLKLAAISAWLCFGLIAIEILIGFVQGSLGLK